MNAAELQKILNNPPDSRYIDLSGWGQIEVVKPIVMQEDNCHVNFAGTKLLAVKDMHQVFHNQGVSNTIFGLTVNGGLDVYVPKGNYRRSGIYCQGKYSRYIDCVAGWCHAGSHAAAWVLAGAFTTLHRCKGIEGGLQNFRLPFTEGFQANDCDSVHLRDRPEFEGTQPRHFTGGAGKKRTVKRIAIRGGRWISNHRWVSNVFDCGTGQIIDLLLSDIEMVYLDETKNTTGNRAFNVLKLDRVRNCHLEKIYCIHPTVADAMFVNIASKETNVRITDSVADGFIGINFAPNGGGGGDLTIRGSRIGMPDNQRLIGGYIGNNKENYSTMGRVITDEVDFICKPTAKHLFWDRSKKNSEWQHVNSRINGVCIGDLPRNCWN